MCGQEEEDENAEVDRENQEGKLAWAGGRKEEATYEAGDAEDKAIAAAVQNAAQQQDVGPDVSPPDYSSGSMSAACMFHTVHVHPQSSACPGRHGIHNATAREQICTDSG